MKLRSILQEIKYIILNYFVCNIPIWAIRKFFYRLFGMKIGKGSRILMKTIVISPQKIEIGEYTFVNERCFLDARNGSTIGDNTTIAVYSKLLTRAHAIDSEDFEAIGDKIVIGNNVALFTASVVLGGAKIEDGCVFSALSLVRKGQYKKGGYGVENLHDILEREIVA